MRKLYVLAFTLLGFASLKAQVYQVGTGIAVNGATAVPAPIQDYYNNSKQQILIRASELSTLGIGAGPISSVGFNVTALNGVGLMEGYTIAMKNTTTTALTSTFETGASTVYGPVNTTVTSTGIYTFTLSTPFNWDGTSNVLVEICEGLTTGTYTNNASTTYTASGFNSYSYFVSDGIAACPSTAATVAGVRPNIYLGATAAPGCNGTPAPGTVSGPASVCSGTSVSLSTAGTSTGSGITFQWQSSTDNVTYTDITGATGPTYSTTQTVPTYYRVKVSCSGSSQTSTSASIQVGILPTSQCYCSPATGTTLHSSVNAYITNAAIASTAFTYSSGTTAAANGYLQVPVGTATGTLQQTATYSLNLSLQLSPAQVSVWLDFNQNGAFEASEYFPATISGATATATITVPAGAVLGQTALRIRGRSVTYTSADACATFGSGETEDYTITIAPPPACAAPTLQPATAVSTSGATVTWTAPATAPASYEIYYSTSSVTPTGTTTPTTTGITTTTQNLTGLTSATTYYVWVRSNCGGSVSAWSAPVSFTTACTAATIPYTENFDGATTPNLPTCTSREDLNGGTTWTTVTAPAGYTGKTLQYSYSSTLPANDYFYTRALNLTAGTSYTLTFKYGNNSTYTEKLKVYYGTSASSAAMTNLLQDYPAITGGAINNGVITFTPAATGTYYIGFQAYSIADQYNLYLDDISVIVTPAPPTTCATNIFPANGATGIATPVTFSWTAVPTATSYTFFLGTNNPPTAADSITTVSTTSVQIIGGAPGTTYYWYVVPKNAGGSASGCVANTTSFTTATPPGNDQCSNAIPLTVNSGFCTSPILGTLAFADSTAGLGGASCAASALKNDVWYTVTVQPGRKAVVQTSAVVANVSDLVMQAYTGVCGSLVAKACDDDGNPEPTPSAAHSRLLLTNTGTVDSTYYIRIMPYSASNLGAFGICAWDSSAARLPVITPGNTNACAPGTSVTVDSLHANLYMWIPLYDGSGRIIGEIYPNGNALGSTASSVYVNSGSVRQYNGQYYLDRNITITPATQPAAANKVRVRLYFTAAELTAFQGAVPSATRANMVATKINTACVSAYTPTQPVLEKSASSSVYQTNDNYIQLDTVSSFSTFFLHLSAVNAPLPANILTFSGSRQGPTNNLKWTVAQEQDVQTYQIERSADGRDWNVIGSVASLGNTSQQRTYTFADNSFSGLKQQYRLRQVDYNGGVKVSTIVIISGAKPTTLTLNGLFPNPALHSINLLVDAPAKDNITIVVMDAVGKIVKTQKATVESGANTLQLGISTLAAGSYLVKVTCDSNCASAVSKFVKE